MNHQTGSTFLRENFKREDRLAVVLLDKRNNAVVQRIASAEQIAAPEFQAWLRYKNAQNYEVYISMNTLRLGATGRTKTDIEAIRHIYLDFDEHGTEAVDRLMKRKDLPAPTSRVSTSPGKWQIAWRVEAFTVETAERLQRWLARESGADPAATDASRVLRLPGFYNHKYQPGHLVTTQALSAGTYRPKDFPEPNLQREHSSLRPSTIGGPPKSGLSQSERDWAFAKRALARGEPADLVTLAIAALRRDEKHDSYAYARHTVDKAVRQLNSEHSLRPENTNLNR